MTEPLQPYERIRSLAEGIHYLDGDWYDSPFRRRMTVVRLRSGALVIHNAIALKEEDYASLEALGEPRWIVVPNRFHGSEAHVYRDRYPETRVLASPQAVREVQKRCPVDGSLPEDWPQALKPELDCREILGTRLVGESALFHRASRTLILTDLVFNLGNETRGIQKALFKLNRLDRGLGPSRIFESFFVRDRETFGRSIRAMLDEWDFDRILMSHGEILHSGGKAALERAFARYLG